MAKKTKTGVNPWTGKTYEIKESNLDPNVPCPDCEDEKSAWGTVKAVTGFMGSEAKLLSNKRLEICKACPHSRDLYSRGWINYCNLCGCMLKVKTRLKKSKCPDGRW
jgi:hypothetical protein